MPIKRSATVMRLSDLSFWERFMFLSSTWSPDRHEGTRWRSWAQYFETYELVRVELLAEQRPWPPFAEHARSCFLAGTDPAEARAAFHAGVEAFMARRGAGA